jgi:ankyrin repeat protein
MKYTLFEACDQKDLDKVEELLDNGADPNLLDPDGWTVLMVASYRGQTDVVWLLLDHGADPNLQNEYGQTALMKASNRDHIDIIRLLLDHGADLNLQHDDGRTALMSASWRGHIHVVKLLEAACWNRNVAQPLIDLGIFPEGLIREHLMKSIKNN